MLAELRNVVPALLQHSSAEQIFSAVAAEAARYGQFQACRPLLVALLRLLCDHQVTPPSAALISSVAAALACSLGDDARASESEEGPPLDAVLARLADPGDLKLVLPLVGGLSAGQVEALLPRVLLALAEDPEWLKAVFSAATKSRPPPMSRAGLLVALHRIDCDATPGLKPKVVLDALALCLGNKAEFGAEVVKEGLRALLSDAVPAFPLMRTAILAGQVSPDVKRFVLTDVVPALVGKRAWLSAPKVWDGVVFAVKSVPATGFRNLDQTVASLLELPGAQLRALLKAAPSATQPLASALSLLGAERIAELTQQGGDAEKARLFKELAQPAK